MKKFVLASSSPRRIEMLKKWGFSFEAVSSPFEEKQFSSPQTTALYNAYGKAFEIARKKGILVIGADTIVVIEGKILGKPRNDCELFDMLKMLSGKVHTVITGVAAIKDKKFATDICLTKVGFRDLNEEEIKDYIRSGEGRDKAGGYAIQGIGSSFINMIDGQVDNVIGLPVNKVRKMIKLIER